MLRQTTLLPYLPVKDKNGMVLKTSLQLIMVNIKESTTNHGKYKVGYMYLKKKIYF